MFAPRLERPADAPAIDALLDRCFGPDRRAKTSYRYRDGVPPRQDLCLVAEGADGGAAKSALVGAIRYWPIRLDADRDAQDALLLGPLAIEPDLQGRGIGRALVFETLNRAARSGAKLVFLVGEPAYYDRFGFKPVPPGIVMPNEQPRRLQYVALGGARMPLSGVLRPALSAAIAVPPAIGYSSVVGA